MEVDISIGSSPGDRRQSQAIRRSVFVREQKIPQELDLDGQDAGSLHLLAKVDGVAVGTARSSISGPEAVLARVAVLPGYREKGIATALIRAALCRCREAQVRSLWIHAHRHLRAYYASFGFEFVRDVEVVGEHQLIAMQLAM